MIVQHRVNSDHIFLWEMAKFDPLQNQNPVTGWYEIVMMSGRYSRKSNFVEVCAVGASRESGEI